MTAQRATGGS
uniref:Uncharacterized protein n=1 Tax=Anguilla anguilla TaxID=7936 RepID=A0A0E9TIM0_ANGAN